MSRPHSGQTQCAQQAESPVSSCSVGGDEGTVVRSSSIDAVMRSPLPCALQGRPRPDHALITADSMAFCSYQSTISSLTPSSHRQEARPATELDIRQLRDQLSTTSQTWNLGVAQSRRSGSLGPSYLGHAALSTVALHKTHIPAVLAGSGRRTVDGHRRSISGILSLAHVVH